MAFLEVIREGSSGEHRGLPVQTIARGCFQKMALLRTLSVLHRLAEGAPEGRGTVGTCEQG